MLQRAASNAYSWWWASHIRTKQSKWLEHNLEEMEDKVKLMLQIIDEDGDSFAKRAEMYYRKRPELVCFVEDAYRAYRALAERYDHLSRELQNANRTIATVFPEQEHFAMDEDGENQTPRTPSDSSSPSNSKVVPPAVPKSGLPKLPMLSRNYGKAFYRKQLKRQEASKTTTTSSGLSKSEALEEIDKLQKGILALQTEKEFLKSSYEAGLAKYWELEKQITEKQAKVCRLQDEFGIGTIIDDDDARNLMAATALSSCEDTLARLREKHEQWTEEARAEYQKIRAAHEKLKARKNDHLFGQGEDQQQDDPSSTELEMLEDRDRRLGLELLQHNQKIKEQFELNSGVSFNMTELADKIDELVNKIINLESAMCSHTALVERLILETGRLQAHIQSLEDDETENLGRDSEDVKNKLRELEKELQKVKELSQSIEDKTHRLQMEFTEANYNLDHLKEKLQTVKPDDEAENGAFVQEGANVNKSGGHDEDVLDGSDNASHMRVEGVGDYSPSFASSDDIEVESVAVQSELNPQSSLDTLQGEEIENEKQDHNDFEMDQPQKLGEKAEDLPKWRQLLSNEQFDEREKILVEEYTAILHDYREAKKKLSDAEKKNRDNFFELAMQIKELRNENASKNTEIQSLHQKLSAMQSKPDEAFNVLGQPNVQSTLDERIERTSPDITSERDEEMPIHMGESHSFSAIEEKFRSDINSLLDENLEFWLRFSTSFHQIQKFQTSIQDLKGEVSKLNRQLGSGSTKLQYQFRKSDARPIYKHLREIQTELTLWTEQNASLKDELQSRLLNLNSIHDDIVMVSNANAGSRGKREDQHALDQYLAAKFQGEVLNMKQETNKISAELRAGFVRVRGLEVDIQKTLARMEDDFGLPARKLQGFQHANKQSTMQRRVPLRSFLFGKKKKHKPSIFSCMSPAFQKHFNDMNHTPGFGFPT